MKRRCICSLFATAVAVCAAVLPWDRPAAAQPDEADEPGQVFVFAAPGLTWADVEDQELPALEGFFADAAVAAMAPRSVVHRSRPGEAYLTISAGTRSTSDELVDGQVLGLEEGDLASPAGEIFERRTGVRPDGEFVALGWPTLERSNESEPYDAELGLLAETLQDDDVATAVIGNADGKDSAAASYERHVGLALADHDGVVAGGELEPELLVTDPARPFGVRFDPGAVLDAFRDVWDQDSTAEENDGSVVLVEASDLARTIRYRPFVDSDRFEELRTEALIEADELFGELLAEVDPQRDTVLVVGPYLQTGEIGLSVAALRTPTSSAGYLRTATTQRAGIVSLVDVAPTILSALDITAPEEMEGRRFEVVSSSDSLDSRVEHLVQINDASRFRENLLTPTTIAIVLALAAIVALTVAIVAGEWSGRARAAVRFSALAALSALPMSYVARAFPLEDLGIGFYWTFLVASSLAVAALATLLAVRTERPRVGLVAVLGLMLTVLLGDAMTGSNLSLSAAFGYSPTSNSRLYGISNYSFGQVAAASLLLAAFIASRWPTTRARIAALALLVFTLVVLGVPTWGSDVGGVLAFTPAILVFAALIFQYRVRVRSVLIAGVATVVAVTAFGFVDLARPASQRAHLGRLFERVGNEGLEPLLSIMERKLVANVRVSTSSFWVTAIPIGIAFWIFLVRYRGRPMRALRARVTGLHAGLVAAAVAAVLGSLVNDSGAIVGGVTVMVATVSLAFLVTEQPVETLTESVEPAVEEQRQPPVTAPQPVAATVGGKG